MANPAPPPQPTPHRQEPFRQQPQRLRLLAPAKINLHLRVGKPRGDGFHPLVSWMCTVGLFDRLDLEAAGITPGLAPRPTGSAGAAPPSGDWERAGGPGSLPGATAGHAAAGQTLEGRTPGGQTAAEVNTAKAVASLELEGDHAGLPCDARNLVVRIAEGFAGELLMQLQQQPPREVRSGVEGTGELAYVSDAAGGALRERGAGRQPGKSPEPGKEDGVQGAATDATCGPGKVGGFCNAPPVSREASEATPRVQGVAARLAKRIPVGAGLGGGSSDAARMLLGLNRVWQAGWPVGRLSALAARFGSDLSFFVHAAAAAPGAGGSAVCTGRGEVVRLVAPPGPRWAVLVLPGIELPTPQVYRRFDEMGLGSDLAEVPDWAEWSRLDSASLLRLLVNDLEPAALSIVPALGQLRAEAERLVGRTVRMSGSGSSLFTLYDAEADAGAAAAKVAGGLNVRAVAVEVCPEVADDLNAGAVPG